MRIRLKLAMVAAALVSALSPLAGGAQAQSLSTDAWASAWGDFSPFTVTCGKAIPCQSTKPFRLPIPTGVTAVVITCHQAMSVEMGGHLIDLDQMHTPLGLAQGCHRGGSLLFGLQSPFTGRMSVAAPGKWSFRVAPIGDLPELPTKASKSGPGIYRFGGIDGRVTLTVPAVPRNKDAFYPTFDLAQYGVPGSESSIISDQSNTAAHTLTGTLLTSEPSIVFVGWSGSIGLTMGYLGRKWTLALASG